MGDSGWSRQWEIFHEAVELAPAERGEYLDRTCEGDPELRERVERLLRAHEQESRLLDLSSQPGAQREGEHLRDPLIGQTVGRYQVDAVVGHGGMGVVYDARQSSPVRRRVALKIIRVGMDTREVVTRFELERHALALMSHPNIARILDADATAEGRPYFAMEFVEGKPVTEYCDGATIDLEGRLELFLQVCAGVQHAHQKGIIHRDLKPTNVLVAVEDGDTPTPKIIDFGVAKATAQRLTERTLQTKLGVVLGTPAYMSPEQAGMSELDVDTRTDVYALGVLLYELLVGKLPFDPEELEQAGFDEVRRRIREDDPSRPSTRIQALSPEDARELSSRRRTESSSWTRRVAGDLDWIVMKALEKDRARRYGSAAELAADVERHLRNQPVDAGPPGAGYRMSKFVRRHRVGTGVAAAALLVLVAFGATMTVQSRRVAAARDLAEEARAAAEDRAEYAMEVKNFLVSVFRHSDPGASGADTTAREVLEAGRERVMEALADRPKLQAEVVTEIAAVYRNLGDLERARELLEQAETMLRGVDDPSFALSNVLQALGVLSLRAGRYDEARTYLEECVEIERGLNRHEGGELTKALAMLGWLAHREGRFDEAIPLYQDLVDYHRVHETVQLPAALANLGAVHQDAGMSAKAATYLQEAESELIEDGSEGTATHAQILNNLGLALRSGGDLAGAAEAQERALEINRSQYGGEHTSVALNLNNLALVRQDLGDYAGAEEAFRESMEIHRNTVGVEHPNFALAQSNLARALHLAGQLDGSLEYYRESLGRMRESLQPAHPNTTLTLTRLAALQIDRGELEEAETLAGEAVEGRRSSLAEGHWRISQSEAVLGSCLAAQKRFEEAEELLVKSLQGLTTERGADAIETVDVRNRVAELYEAWGNPARAEEYR